MRLAIAVLAAASLVALDGSAQSFPRRDRQGGSPRESYRESPRAVVPDDPFSALERELPSLKVDLKLTEVQVSAWSAFERDVREVAEMDRAKRRRLMALRNAADAPPGGLEIVARLADDERNKAEATADLRRHLESLYALLDDSQRKMLDRRLWLSQTEPLGR
jgi:hypothetical protein